MIIGFSGPKGCGKDLAYQIIKEQFPDKKIEKIAFADPIKQFLCSLLNIDLETYDRLKRVQSLSLVDQDCNETLTTIPGRQLVREIGMMMRNYDDQQFNRYVYQQVASNPDTVYVCTDVRFENEVELIQDICGGTIVLIERDGYNYDNHVTEQQISRFDYKIKNTTLEQYQKDIRAIFESVTAYHWVMQGDNPEIQNEFKLTSY